MKLLTEMVDGCPVLFAKLGEHPGVERVLSHDAAAAHALMQAMDERPFHASAWKCLQERASELMREWGFDSGEVE